MLDLSFKVNKVVNERSKNYPDHSHVQSELQEALLGRELRKFQQSAGPFDTIVTRDLSLAAYLHHLPSFTMVCAYGLLKQLLEGHIANEEILRGLPWPPE